MTTPHDCDIPHNLAVQLMARELTGSAFMERESQANIMNVNNLVRHSGARHLDELDAGEGATQKKLGEDAGGGGTGVAKK